VTNKNNNNVLFQQNCLTHYFEMANRTNKMSRIDDPDGYGKRTGQCGETIELFLKIHNDQIYSVTFYTDGCQNTRACANTIVYMVEGKSISQAWKITSEAVVDYLGTLPSKDAHCAELAVGALYLALADCKKVENNKRYNIKSLNQTRKPKSFLK
jgi:nitrogen fixation protein NifU and related proteins